MRSRWCLTLALGYTFFCLSLVGTPPARAGRIVVANDDWTLSDTGFYYAPDDTGTFARNVASWFTEGRAGSFLVYSNHFGLTNTDLRDAMTSAGHSWTVKNTSAPFNLEALLAYDGVFVGGIEEGESAPDNGVLTAYVKAGGNVYVFSAGNAWDPGKWNSFLGEFGLAFSDKFLFVGLVPITSSHTLFLGVGKLLTYSGSYIIDLEPSDPRSQLLVHYDQGYIYAIYDGRSGDQGPITSNVLANPNLIEVDGSVLLTATVADMSTGGSNIVWAQYRLDGGPWTLMTAQDGAFDEVSEDTAASFAAPSVAGVYDLCVRGTNAAGQVGDLEGVMLVVYDPSGGFVTGGGWIDSPPGAYAPDPALAGKANFGFVSKYQKDATVPTGQTEFVFKAGDLTFRSGSYDWLVVNQNGSNAQFKGSGAISGSGTYKFMLWARDDGDTGDTFRIKIWQEEDGTEDVVYDNGFDQTIGAGSIVVHAK